ncbi:MAG: hypothetical protein ACOX5R_07305 [bacterium]
MRIRLPRGDAGGNSEVAVIVAIYPDGSVEEYAGFLADDGTPYLGNMDTIRTDGNPPKIAGDLRDGSARYAVANESTPYNYDEFTSDDRWANDYIDHIFAVQILELTPDGPQKITNVFDPMYGAQSDLVVGKIRTGGVVFLSNGNLLVGAEDRSLEGASPKAPNISIIDGETGEIIHGPIHVLGTGEYDFWEGLAAFNGGFAVRVGNGGVVDGNATTIIKFYDNDGNELGSWLQKSDPALQPLDFSDNPEGFTTSITTTGRGDGNGLASHINSNYVYYAGQGPDPLTGAGADFVYVTKIDATTMQSVDEVLVPEQIFNGEEYDNNAGVNRVFVTVDENDNVFVGWSDIRNTGTAQIQGRFYDSELEPVTETFLVFQNSDPGDGTFPLPGIVPSTFHGAGAMDTERLVVAARTTGYVIPGETDPLPNNTNIFTVLRSPFAGQDVRSWDLF